MRLDDFNYDLPDSLIAAKPPKHRGDSRLLVCNRATKELSDKKYCDIVDYLDSGDVLVINDTKVIKARLITKKQNGVERELVILEKHGYDDDWHRHRVMYRKSLKIGDQLTVDNTRIVVEKIEGGGIAVVSSDSNLLELVGRYGEVPLPPYMNRRATSQDLERYQTVWAREAGSVAAPTASLNMTDDILERLRNKGINVVYLTLHVGLGTFLPIRTDKLEGHHMHEEYFNIPEDTINVIRCARKNGKRVVALGTTVARTLEYVSSVLLSTKPGSISGEANIFIYPSYDFRVVDCLLTNFHAPKSTVLMLAAAFAGWGLLQEAYSHAAKEGYYFLSYGDSMLVL